VPVISALDATMSAPSEDDVFLLLGQVVFEMQETEATLHLAMTVAFGISAAKSVEQLKDLYAKKTLGQFLLLMRDRIGLSPSFGDFMKDYIERRNFAIHNFSRTSIFNVYTEEGREKLADFLTDLRYRNRKVKLTFVALTEAWLRILDLKYASEGKFKEIIGAELYGEIVRDFVPTLREIFSLPHRSGSSEEGGRPYFPASKSSWDVGDAI
jgi:hypothetical protein